MHIFTVCRIALEFLDSKAFSKDYSRHLKGEPAMKKRHLEMLGYRVVQVSISNTLCPFCFVSAVQNDPFSSQQI